MGEETSVQCWSVLQKLNGRRIFRAISVEEIFPHCWSLLVCRVQGYVNSWYTGKGRLFQPCMASMLNSSFERTSGLCHSHIPFPQGCAFFSLAQNKIALVINILGDSRYRA